MPSKPGKRRARRRPTQGEDPRRELTQISAGLSEINQKASVLLEGFSEETRGFTNSKVGDQGAEKRRLERSPEELGAVS